MPDQDLLANVRRSLEAERDSLRARLDDLEVDNDVTMAFDENFADSGQVAAEQGEYHVLAGSLSEQLAAVERTLGRLDAGTYGRCETCGGEISPARLEAIPTARWCIEHAER